MAKSKARKVTGKGGTPLPLVKPRGAGDSQGPCAQTDQAVADCQAAVAPLAGLAALMQSQPTVNAAPVYQPATGTWKWEPLG